MLTISIYWLIFMALLILIELLTLGLITIWFAGGALAAFVASLLVDQLLMELIVFLVVSISLLYFTRPMVLKYFKSGREKKRRKEDVDKEALMMAAIYMNSISHRKQKGREKKASKLY